MKSIKQYIKKVFQNFINSPYAIQSIAVAFITVVLISSGIVFGSSSVKTKTIHPSCSKIGFNLETEYNFVDDYDIDKAFGYGANYVLAYVNSYDDFLKISNKFLTYKDYSKKIKFIIAPCRHRNNCSFKPSFEDSQNPLKWEESGRKYGDFVSKLYTSLENLNFDLWVVSGHTSVNGFAQSIADQYIGDDLMIPAQFEKAFIKGFLETNPKNKGIHLLSPEFNINGQESVRDYLASLDYAAFQKFDGISIFFTESIVSDYYESYDVEVIMNDQYSLFNKPLFITNYNSSNLTNEFEKYYLSLRKMRQKDFVSAVLIDNGLNLDINNVNSKILKDETMMSSLLGECFIKGSSNSISKCVFDDNKVAPCETESKNISREINLSYIGDKKWKGGYLLVSQILKLPAFNYFQSTAYTGTSTAQHPSQGASQSALSPNTYTLSASGKVLYYDIDKKNLHGFAELSFSKSNLVTRPKLQYYGGSAVLLSSMGDPSDPDQKFQLPAQFLTDRDSFQGASDDRFNSTFSSDAKWTNKFSKLIEFFQGILDAINPKCVSSGYKLDAVYRGDATYGEKTIAASDYFEFDLSDVIANSNLYNTIGGDCYTDTNGDCLIKTDLSQCNPCVESEDGSVTCEKIKYGSLGEVVDGQEQSLVDCINSKGIKMNFEMKNPVLNLSGAGYILKTYWKKLNRFETKKICHRKNIGIEVEISNWIYDIESDGCMVGSEIESLNSNCGSGDLFDQTKCSKRPREVTIKSYYPFFGSLIQGASYLDLDQQSPNFDSKNLSNCKDADNDDILCYCDESLEIDPLGMYLADLGLITTDDDLAMLGKSKEEIEAISNNNEELIDIGQGKTYPFYQGTCSEIFEKIKQEYSAIKPSILDVQLVMVDQTKGGCNAYTKNTVTCRKGLSMFKNDCNDCPVQATALFRHELGHHLVGRSFFGNDTAVSEFATDAKSNNGGWYWFKIVGSNKIFRATELMEYFIAKFNIDRQTFIDYLFGSYSARASILKIFNPKDYIVEYGYGGAVPENLKDCKNSNQETSWAKIDPNLINKSNFEGKSYSATCPAWVIGPYPKNQQSSYSKSEFKCTQKNPYLMPTSNHHFLGTDPTDPGSCDSPINYNRLFGTGNDYDLVDPITRFYDKTKILNSTCKKIEQNNLTNIDFFGKSITVNKKIVDDLSRVVDEIKSFNEFEMIKNYNYNGKTGTLIQYKNSSDQVIKWFMRYSDTGCYNCRGNVNSGTNWFEPSPHMFGIGCDINWNTHPNKGGCKRPDDIDKIPDEVIHAFIKNKFQWGGWWDDTMHFEYAASCYIPCNPMLTKKGNSSKSVYE